MDLHNLEHSYQWEFELILTLYNRVEIGWCTPIWSVSFHSFHFVLYCFIPFFSVQCIRHDKLNDIEDLIFVKEFCRYVYYYFTRIYKSEISKLTGCLRYSSKFHIKRNNLLVMFLDQFVFITYMWLEYLIWWIIFHHPEDYTIPNHRTAQSEKKPLDARTKLFNKLPENIKDKGLSIVKKTLLSWLYYYTCLLHTGSDLLEWP